MATTKHEIDKELNGSKITLDFTGVSDSPAGGGKYVNRPGKFLFEVVKIEKAEGRNSEYANINFTCEVISSDDQKGRLITERCTLNPKGLFRLRNMLMALTDRDIEKKALKVDFSKLLGKKFGGTVDAETNDTTKKTYHKLTEVYPASKYVPEGKAADDEVEDGLDDIDEDELG